MPRRDVDDAQALEVLEIDDAELGIRSEDRYVSLPTASDPIPRRAHHARDRAPLVLLLALVLFFGVGAWLDGLASSGGGGDGGPDEAPIPGLDRSTGATLVVVDDAGITRVDVDSGELRRVAPIAGRVREAVRADEESVVVRTDEGVFVTNDGGELLPLPDADALVASPNSGRVWLVDGRDIGPATAQEVDVRSGMPVDTIGVDGAIAGAAGTGLVVERPSGSLELLEADGTARELAGALFLASSADSVATRDLDCSDVCTLTIEDLEHGIRRQADIGRGRGVVVAQFSPDGRRLAVLHSDGTRTQGVVVDSDEETVTEFEARAVPRDASPAAWSDDGEWLFLVTARGGLDAVAADGGVYRVDIELPEVRALLRG